MSDSTSTRSSNIPYGGDSYNDFDFSCPVQGGGAHQYYENSYNFDHNSDFGPILDPTCAPPLSSSPHAGIYTSPSTYPMTMLNHDLTVTTPTYYHPAPPSLGGVALRAGPSEDMDVYMHSPTCHIDVHGAYSLPQGNAPVSLSMKEISIHPPTPPEASQPTYFDPEKLDGMSTAYLYTHSRKASTSSQSSLISQSSLVSNSSIHSSTSSIRPVSSVDARPVFHAPQRLHKAAEKLLNCPELLQGTKVPKELLMPFLDKVPHRDLIEASIYTKGEGSRQGAKEYVCLWNHCGHRIKRRDHAIDHVAVHVGSRPFSCPECSLRFLRVADLRRHVKTGRHQEFPTGAAFESGNLLDVAELHFQHNSNSGQIEVWEQCHCHGKFFCVFRMGDRGFALIVILARMTKASTRFLREHLRTTLWDYSP